MENGAPQDSPMATPTQSPVVNNNGVGDNPAPTDSPATNGSEDEGSSSSVDRYNVTPLLILWLVKTVAIAALQ